MEKKQAITLIEDTFNAKFDENRFSLFIKNLLNDVEPKSNRYSGQMLWDDHKEHINSYKRIGKYIDPEGEPLDVLIVEVKTIAKLERARTSLRNFVIKHLSKFDKDYALVAFYAKEDDGVDWRFSFIKLEHQSYFDEEKDKVKIKKEFTPAKRYSFLVGEYEQSHTAKTQLLPLLQNLANNPTVEDLENAFSIEKVTEEFFSQYKDLYVKLYEHFNKDSHIKNELEKAKIDNARFTKKLLGQIVFLYFLQKKGWLGVPKNEKWGNGDKRFIQNLFEKSNKENYFKDYLQPLFYEALAKERGNEHSFYKRFNCRIPFLNGGLFEAEYKWETANITIPENLFRNQEKNKAGDIGTGVLDVFDRYNFTIKEDEPLDKEVAVDPEMLGKVFENMLEITERKSKGAFYTPREIVHYMCQESLIHYLDNSLDGTVKKQDIETYIRKGHNALENDKRVAKKGEETATYKYILPKSIRDNANLIDQKLIDIKICDPAIGSGAFPVGLLHELVNAQLVIKPHFTDKYANTKLKGFGFSTNVAPSESRYIYRLKRHIIQESIYGVDIDASAIDIARLRLWLSLVVDEDDFDPIETLPNLDYKIVCGNSLISRYDLDMPIDNVFKEFNKKVKDKEYKNQTIKKFIGNQDIDLAYYKKLTNDFLLESSHDKKVLFRELISEIKNAFTSTLGNKALKDLSKARGVVENLQQSDIFGSKVGTKTQINTAKKHLAKLEKQKQETEDGALYKDAIEWRFEFPNLLDNNGDFVGFDVVIANPPYGAKLTSQEKNYFKVKYSNVHMRTPDTFNYFISDGFSVLKKGGVLNFIVPNNLLFQSEFEKTRRFLLNDNQFYIGINLGDGVFNAATVPSCIILASKQNQNIEKYNYADIRNANKKNLDFNSIFQSESVSSTLQVPASVFGISESEFKIIQKLKLVSTTIDDIAEEMASGISTGGDKMFRISKEEAINLNLEKELLKPVLVGGEIDKYKIKNTNHYVIYTDRNTVINDFPIINNYLLQFREKLMKRSEAKSGVMPWFALNRQRYPLLFEENKIIMRQTSDRIRATYDFSSFYVIDSILVFKKLKGDLHSYKYILAMLNSSVNGFLYRKFTQEGGRTFAQVKPKNVRKLYIPFAKEHDQNVTSNIVNYLMAYSHLDRGDSDNIVNSFYQSVLDAISFELFLPKEIEQANKQVLKHLADLNPIDDEMSPEEKLAIIQSEFERLYHPEHPVRFAVETLDSIEEVRIIKEALR